MSFAPHRIAGRRWPFCAVPQGVPHGAIIGQFAGGAVLGCLFVSGLIGLDIAGLGTVIAGAQVPVLPLALLFAHAAALFGLAAAATACDGPPQARAISPISRRSRPNA